MDETHLWPASWAGLPAPLQTRLHRKWRRTGVLRQGFISGRPAHSDWVIGCLVVWMRPSYTQQDANCSEVLNMLWARSSGIGVELCQQKR